jgi:quercetin dioxygenase-like cupin family protein
MTPLETVSRHNAPSGSPHGEPPSARHFDLVLEIDELKARQQYVTTGHAARTLVKRPELRIVLIVLRRGAELKEHRTNQPVSVQTLMGRIRIALPGRAVEPIVGGLVVIEPGVAHDVSALADSAFLISIPWSHLVEG